MNLVSRSLAAVLAIAAPGVAAAAEVPSVPYNWRNVVIGGGGFSPNIIFSPAEKGLAYLRTDVGGIYRWDAKAQRWIPARGQHLERQLLRDREHRTDPKDANTV